MHRDRRRYFRADLPIPIHIFAGSRWMEAITMDISQDGLRIRIDEDVHLNKRLGLRFGNRTDTFGVKVCWTQGSEAGCSFLDTLDELSYKKIIRDSSSS